MNKSKSFLLSLSVHLSLASSADALLLPLKNIELHLLMPARRAGLVCLCFSGAKNGKSLGKAQQLKHTSRYSPSLETETKADAFPHFMPH